ncbi:MAG TPA: HAD family hydrolase, partial [Alphaproteobacteria bacterium]|nr:HAD family hydrolase [Alphaproteobacteria bacterium]
MDVAVLIRQDDTLAIDPDACDAVVFDMDGVLTHTARIHARAWKETFDALLAARSESEGGELEPFDIEDDYRRYVDGKPRYEGVRSFLSARGIELAEGEPDDPPDRQTVRGLGNRKNERFLALLRDEGAKCWEDGVALVRALRDAKVRTGVFSASRNAREVLRSAGITDLFEVRVDGVVAAETGLAGKPAPDVPVEAARRLDAAPERCAIVEDAI